MSRKTEICYRHLFKFIESEIMSLQCESFMTDFERAMRNALRKQYPRVHLFTCWFHFCQAAKRHASQIPTFMAAIRQDKAAATIYHKFLCLPLLPADDIEAAYYELALEAKACNAKLFKNFLEYFENNGSKL